MSDSGGTIYLTNEEYLKFENSASLRHEYICGQIYAMSGATEAHNLLCSNLHILIGNSLLGSGCRVYSSSMKVRVEAADSFYYPDIMVTCEAYHADSVFKSAPSLIAEVLSPSTKHIDRREKLIAYRQISSLRQYIIVHQTRMLVEVYDRISIKDWEYSRFHKFDEVLIKPAGKDLPVPVRTIYEGLDIPSIVEETEEEYLLN